MEEVEAVEVEEVEAADATKESGINAQAAKANHTRVNISGRMEKIKHVNAECWGKSEGQKDEATPEKLMAGGTFQNRKDEPGAE